MIISVAEVVPSMKEIQERAARAPQIFGSCLCNCFPGDDVNTETNTVFKGEPLPILL